MKCIITLFSWSYEYRGRSSDGSFCLLHAHLLARPNSSHAISWWENGFTKGSTTLLRWEKTGTDWGRNEWLRDFVKWDDEDDLKVEWSLPCGFSTVPVLPQTVISAMRALLPVPAMTTRSMPSTTASKCVGCTLVYWRSLYFCNTLDVSPMNSLAKCGI